MKANNAEADDHLKNEHFIELKGTVVRKKFAQGSKSEHDAIYLETDSGSYVLRRIGANAFFDAELQKLVGEKISAKGTINDYIFLAGDIKRID